MWKEFHSPEVVLLRCDSFCLIVDGVSQLISILLWKCLSVALSVSRNFSSWKVFCGKSFVLFLWRLTDSVFPNVKQLRISNNFKMLTFFNISPCQEEPLFCISAVCVCLLKIDLFLEWLTYRAFCLFFFFTLEMLCFLHLHCSMKCWLE